MKKIIIVGNVGHDPEVRANANGEFFATFSVAVNIGSKENQHTDWFEIICNNKKVEFAKQYIKKGDKVLVEGSPTAHGYLKEKEVHTKIKIANPQIEILNRPNHENNDEDRNKLNKETYINKK